MDKALKMLLVNLKNYPWQHYPVYKVERVDGERIVEALKKLEEEERKMENDGK